MQFDFHQDRRRLCGRTKLDSLLERATRDTSDVVQTSDIPTIVAHYAALTDTVDDLKKKLSALQKHVDAPQLRHSCSTLFENQSVKTIKLDGIGRVTVNVRWTASMINKQKGMEWLKTSGNEGLADPGDGERDDARLVRQDRDDGWQAAA